MSLSIYYDTFHIDNGKFVPPHNTILPPIIIWDYANTSYKYVIILTNIVNDRLSFVHWVMGNVLFGSDGIVIGVDTLLQYLPVSTRGGNKYQLSIYKQEHCDLDGLIENISVRYVDNIEETLYKYRLSLLVATTNYYSYWVPGILVTPLNIIVI